MSTETHTAAGGLAEALRGHSLDTMSQDGGQHCKCGSDSRFRQPNDPRWSSIHEHRAHVALSWLAARLTDDDVVEAVARAIGTLNAPGALPDNCPDGEAYRLFARAALAAAADVIGGGSDE